MNIMLACALGMSTSLLVSKMKDAAREQGKDYRIWAVDVESIEYEKGYDIVLIGPQVSNRIAEIREQVGREDIPVVVIDRSLYGRCDGPAILQMAEELIKN